MLEELVYLALIIGIGVDRSERERTGLNDN
jgi:hypothetical protein